MKWEVTEIVFDRKDACGRVWRSSGRKWRWSMSLKVSPKIYRRLSAIGAGGHAGTFAAAKGAAERSLRELRKMLKQKIGVPRKVKR